MGFKNNITPSILVPLFVLLMLVNLAKSDIKQDREKCANQLVGLATCLPYVGGQSRAPPIDCCTGFKQVMQKTPDCICLLIKDRNDPSLGLKINATLALSLPDRCNAHDRNISDCPALLHLPPNSPDAKVFEDFANSAKKSNTTNTTTTTPSAGSSSAATSADQSDGGKRKRFLEIETISVMLIVIFAHHMFYS